MTFQRELKSEWEAACRFASRAENQFSERIVLFLGISLGLILSSIVIHWVPLSHRSLQEARRLGVISWTVLFSYDKSQEFTYYLIALALTTMAALWLWLAWAWRGAQSRKLDPGDLGAALMDLSKDEPLSTALLRRPIPSLILLLILVFLYWSPHFFLRTQYYYHFFSEEGQYFVALEEMLRGGRLYRDVFFIYGPLSIYPTYWMMLLFGPHVEWLRIQTFCFDLFGIVLVYFFLKRFTRRSLTPFLGTLLFVILYFPDWSAPNGGLFRYFAGLIPLMLLSRFFSTKKTPWLIASGLAAGLVFFYSQEIGACALLALAPITCLEVWECEGARWPVALKRALMVIASALVVIGAGIGYFYLRGAGHQFLYSVWTYPRTVALGSFGLAYPNLLQDFENLFLAKRWLSVKIFYWDMECYYPILLYLTVGVVYAIRFFKRQIKRDGYSWVGVAIYGITLFRSALARSNYLKLTWCMVPAFLLLLKILDELWTGISERPFDGKAIHRRDAEDTEAAQSAARPLLEQRSRASKPKSMIAASNAVLIVGLVALLGCYYGTVGRDALTQFSQENIFKFDWMTKPQKISPIDSFKYRTLELPRARGVVVPQEWYDGIVKTAQFFNDHTGPNETLLAFPAAPAYNFLLDRPAPTDVPAPYLCTTSAARETMVRQLDQSRNRFIVYEKLSWRLDNLPSVVHFPELTYYIDTHYRVYRDFGTTKILMRLPKPAERIPLVDF